MLTFRQLQRLLHCSAKSPGRPVRGPEDTREDMWRLVAFLSGRSDWRGDSEINPSITDRYLTSECHCESCISKVENLVGGQYLASLVDAMARKFGPDTSVATFLRNLQRRRPTAEQPKAETADGEDGDSEAGSPDEKEAAINAAISAQAQAIREGAAKTAQTPTQMAQAASAQSAEQQSQANEAAEAAKQQIECLQKQLEKLKADGKESSRQAEELRRAIRHNKQVLKNAKTRQSAVKAGSQPSLTARKGVSRGLARLGRVDVKTRNRMAVLINRILGRGSAGEQLTPIPVTDPRRLVKRMLSRRPLANSFKEDSDSGRPAILFLPDISPSCAAQAQAACDIANAAGYAGVPGADVLVMPHFNGGIDSDCEEYMPWRNGRPMTLHRKEQEQLFADATQGRQFNIRAVVIVGDHDGAHLYREMADQPKIRDVIWLHNYADGRDPEMQLGQFEWPKADTKKVSLVINCTDAERMMRGLELAVT